MKFVQTALVVNGHQQIVSPLEVQACLSSERTGPGLSAIQKLTHCPPMQHFLPRQAFSFTMSAYTAFSRLHRAPCFACAARTQHRPGGASSASSLATSPIKRILSLPRRCQPGERSRAYCEVPSILSAVPFSLLPAGYATTLFCIFPERPSARNVGANCTNNRRQIFARSAVNTSAGGICAFLSDL